MVKNSKKSVVKNTSKSLVLDRKSARVDAKMVGLDRGYLPASIKEVILTLNQAGFEAYIVGGGVRDALLGLEPKDFDAVTNATPSQIKEVFGKRCRIIGRRFQLCHVYSGRDLIEVATFRSAPTDDKHVNKDGMILRDNVWGDIFDDVTRRDFSINALYYQPFEGIVYDFCGGLADVKNRTIRLLGDTQTRIEEDPVRLLRALRFKAKLNFKFDKSLEKQFNAQNWERLTQVSPHRLYDESQKMFSGGYLSALLPLLFDYKALEALLFFAPSVLTPLVEQASFNTDKRVQSGKSVNPAFFYACLLWENYLYLLNKHKKKMGFTEAQIFASNTILERQRAKTAMPKFAEQFIKDIWLMQSRLAEPRKKNLLKLSENTNFRASFDFLLLREQVFSKNKTLANLMGEPITLDTDSTNGMGHWWTWFQTLSHKQREQAVNEFDIEQVKQHFHHSMGENTEIVTTNKKFSKQQIAEKVQLQQLSLVHQQQANKSSTAYFDNIQKMLEKTEAQTQEKSIEKKTPSKKISKLVETIPAQRKRREPSSLLSVFERKQGLTEQDIINAQKAEKSKKVVAKAPKNSDEVAPKKAKRSPKRKDKEA